MKKLLSTTMLLMLSIIAYAQEDVTRFLGIPVDGSKTEMIRKLEEKGFQYDPAADVLVGEFNGEDVRVYVVTNNNKVYRIALRDAHPLDERAIQIRFNRLCEQFANNPKYITLGDFTIPEDEDISYEIAVHNKRYEAVFHQQSAEIDTLASSMLTRVAAVFFQQPAEIESVAIEQLRSVLLSKYTEEQLANPTEEIQDEIRAHIDEITGLLNRPVWFMIEDLYGGYYIAMYYDNEYNQANGEDL